MDIAREIVIPNIKAEISDSIDSRKFWKRVSNTIEAISQIILVISTVLAFAAGYFNNPAVIFATGCCNALCLSLNRYSSFAANESKEQHKILLQQLKAAGVNINIAPVVEN